MDFLNPLFQGLIQVVQWIFSAFYQLLNYLLNGVGVVIGEIVWLFCTGILSVISGIIHAISYSTVVFQFTAGWAGIPPQGIWLVNTLGIPDMITMIAGAYGVRLALNFIPGAFTRV